MTCSSYANGSPNAEKSRRRFDFWERMLRLGVTRKFDDSILSACGNRLISSLISNAVMPADYLPSQSRASVPTERKWMTRTSGAAH